MKIFFVLSILFLAHQSLASLNIECEGKVGGVGEEYSVKIYVYDRMDANGSYMKFSSQISMDDQTREYPGSLGKNADGSGYSYFMYRTIPITPGTLFTPNEIYIFTNGGQSYLQYEWKYSGMGKCYPASKVEPGLCTPLFGKGGGFMRANLTCH